MATITASMFMALDGVVDPAVGNWHFPISTTRWAVPSTARTMPM
jgi:hypothetical protein